LFKLYSVDNVLGFSDKNFFLEFQEISFVFI